MKLKEKLERLNHDKLGWGYPEEIVGFDGISFTSTCRFCKRKILQDSQGNWFHV